MDKEKRTCVKSKDFSYKTGRKGRKKGRERKRRGWRVKSPGLGPRSLRTRGAGRSHHTANS